MVQCNYNYHQIIVYDSYIYKCLYCLQSFLFLFFLFFCWYGISPVFVILFLGLVWSCNINLGYTDKFELLPCLSLYQDSTKYDNFT